LLRLVVERGSNAAVGYVNFHAPPDADGMVEIGYQIVPAARRRGYATEGAAALLHHAFTALGAEAVFATTMAVNTPSRRVMERLGMRHVRTFTEHHDDPLPGSEHGEVEYRVERAEHLARSG